MPSTKGVLGGSPDAAVYTVHMRRPALDPGTRLRLVKEGFSWPAFFFSFVWALWSRLWLVAAGLLRPRARGRRRVVAARG